MKPIVTTDSIKLDFGLPFPDRWTYNQSMMPWDWLGMSKEEMTAIISDPKHRDYEHTYNEAQLILRMQKLAKEDPIKYGWTLPTWRRVMELWNEYDMFVFFGGNRSSKSTLASRICVHCGDIIPEAKIRCFAVNEDKSIEDQQEFIWDALPQRFKGLTNKRSDPWNFSYSQKNGFTGNSIIFKPHEGYDKGSAIYFNNYRQYLLDPQIAEGWKSHLMWADEEAPANLITTLLARSGDFHGKLLLTFTTLKGWTDLVTSILKDARIDKMRYSTYIGKELPYEMTSRIWDRCKILYFWSEDNTFYDYKYLERKYANHGLAEKLARLHGIPTKSFSSKFPKFNPAIHVVPHDSIPFIKDKSFPVTRYFGMDPSTGRNWPMLWVGVTKYGRKYVYREWPDMENYGEWALPHQNAQGKPIGKPGPAAKKVGYGYDDYADLIKELESGEEIFERVGDPRACNTPTANADGESTIMSEMADRGIDVIQAPGNHIAHGAALIEDDLNYDDNEPISEANEPALYISDRCGNLIYGLQEYTGEAGGKEATKDFPDILRYLYEHGLDYVDETSLAATGGWGGY